MPKTKIAIVGAGIIGLTSALSIKEQIPDAHVTIFSDKFSPHTTSDLSNGLWYPFCFSKNDCTEKDLVLKWGKETYDRFMSICSSNEASEAGGQIINCFVLTKKSNIKDPIWRKIVAQYKTLSENDAKLLGFSEFVKSGFQYLTPEFEMKRYLQFLMEKLEKKGVYFQKKRFDSLEEVNSKYHHKFDYVINCTGFGARELLDDRNVFVVKDELVKVDAPWFKNAVIFEDHDNNALNYVVPMLDTVLIGGIHPKNINQYQVNGNDLKNVINCTVSLVPNLQSARILNNYTGLWSFRNGGVRLEKETLRTGNEYVKVIHNYGHGGSGVSLCWGCGMEVADMIKQDLRKSY